MQISHEVLANFNLIHGQIQYFHLNDSAENKTIITEIVSFTDYKKFWHYAYITNAHQPAILLLTVDDTIKILLNGNYDFSENKITKNKIHVTYELTESYLSELKDCPLDAYELLEAFGHLSDSLQELKRHKIS
jgi:hypothetical protein